MPSALRLIALALPAVAIATSCSSASRPAITETLDGGFSHGACDVVGVCTPDPNGVCQHTCTPDPGPRLVKCADAEQNFTFKTIWTFDEPPVGNAHGMYSYTDNSTTIRTFMAINNQTNALAPKTWEPPTAILPRCSDQPSADNHAIHIQGGPFLSWGGGVGIGMKNYQSDTSTISVTSTAATPADSMIDVSGYEGISFWARRGPDSQAGFRVLIGDKYTDDDISYIMYRNDPTQPRYCERVRECGCLNHQSCVAVHLDRPADGPDGGLGEIQSSDIPSECAPTKDHLGATQQVMKFCGTPQAINGFASSSQGGSTCNTCVETKCNERWPAFPDDCGVPGGGCPAGSPNPASVDRQFYGKPCSPYTLRNGIFGYWCFDPAAGERPAEPTEQCGDHWTRVVNLSTEWQFYTVPFNAMAQQGWAKRSAGLDLTAVSVVRFTWDGGWVDFWIDDVRFYKHKPQPQ